MQGHPSGSAVVNDQTTSASVTPSVETSPLAVAVYAVDAASAADGVNVSVRPSDDRADVPGTGGRTGLEAQRRAGGEGGALKVAETGRGQPTRPGDDGAGVCEATASAVASCVNTTSTR